jgi:hypothetical protein
MFWTNLKRNSNGVVTGMVTVAGTVVSNGQVPMFTKINFQSTSLDGIRLIQVAGGGGGCIIAIDEFGNLHGWGYEKSLFLLIALVVITITNVVIQVPAIHLLEQ